MNDLVTVAICNFNTTELTNNCIRSIKSMLTTFTPKFTILDNSNQRFFHLDRYIHATVIDNTHNKFINFNLLLKQSPYKLMPYNANNYGSFKHACSIQFLINICTTPYMLLFDSDTILKKDIDFVNDNVITCADLEEYGMINRTGKKKYTSRTRFLPFIQFFNIKMMHKYKVKYFDYTRIHGILAPNNGNYYDTGASMFADVVKKKLSYRRINYHNYIDHLEHGSWKHESYEN